LISFPKTWIYRSTPEIPPDSVVGRTDTKYLDQEDIKHVRGKPHHPQTQGKIERYHRSMKNVIRLENYYSPEELKSAIAAFVDYYNNRRYHESLNNLTPADVYFGRDKEILRKRKEIKQKTMIQRRMDNDLRNVI
jgi:hypothetical protein